MKKVKGGLVRKMTFANGMLDGKLVTGVRIEFNNGRKTVTALVKKHPEDRENLVVGRKEALSKAVKSVDDLTREERTEIWDYAWGTLGMRRP